MIHNKKIHIFSTCYSRKVFVCTVCYVLFCAIVVSAAQYPSQETESLSLTPAEKSWIAEHKVWRIGVDPDFAPFEFFGAKGKHSGIGADYLRIVAEKLGVNLELSREQSWTQVIDGVKAKQVDVLAVAAMTPERTAYLAFSKPYLKFPTVVACRADEEEFGSLADFNGRKVALVKN